ncbi:MAG: Thymidylate kinase [Alphaproteobacteria bacterium MarineAlpha5_Bin6]|nr:MAG: Thymidylate kinase [Alphaproteobacteria bacterium MarineAlpha5_Bin7]PPR54504.1 MAG: Thymidylate kinase [Alphaproteobacteria bacterium MarineAlpha5_Bin6]|tara:strand:- start:10875 stop:11504 length:630 start_codon:yes stop_codon:yes gene_type:complete
MKFNSNGLFISFEGPEASGKSTQIKLLAYFLKKNKIPFLITREPGGTKIAEKLRRIILDKKANITATEEILLLMSARMNHINNIIKPALKEGKIVISDRFADSTFVYQGHVNKYGMKKTIDLHRILLNNFLPIKTFLFILPVNQIIKRLKKRNVTNKYDKIDTSFHKNVINGYMKLSKNKRRFIFIDALNSTNEINDKIVKSINNLILK